ncbi:MAG: hypothetical protein AB7F43_01815 [Bacteriovoracia bacterium]
MTRIIDCTGCGKSVPVHARELCHYCYQRRLCLRILNELDRNLKPESEYNRQLFTLYLTYTKRLLTLKSCTWMQAKKLAAILEEKPISIIQDWAAVHGLSKKHQLGYQSYRKRKNCAFLRIGYMLQEIGVLPNLQIEQSIALQNHLAAFDEKSLAVVKKYIEMMRRRKRLPKTIVLHLISLKFLLLFLKESDPTANLLTANHGLIEKFIEAQARNRTDPLTINPRVHQIKHFYRWARVERLILCDPCAKIERPLPAPKVRVCSPEQIERLVLFMKNPKADARQAMILALAMFFGFTARDIVLSRLEIRTDSLCLLPQKVTARNPRSFRPPEVVALPRNPKWFYELQKRFYADWCNHYKTLRTPQPIRWLILPGNMRSNNPTSYNLIRMLVRRATTSATGTEIPIRFLRQTCGHIYATDCDASILNRFGWAPSTAYKYVWTPRVFYSRPSKSTRT